MNHSVATRDQWLAQRKALLTQEKQLTRLRDKVAGERRALPWVRVDKTYVFDTPEGPRALADLFEGRRQLVVQHFMLGPGWAQGCPSCSYMADHISGMQPHLNARDTTVKRRRASARFTRTMRAMCFTPIPPTGAAWK